METAGLTSLLGRPTIGGMSYVSPCTFFPQLPDCNLPDGRAASIKCTRRPMSKIWSEAEVDWDILPIPFYKFYSTGSKMRNWNRFSTSIYKLQTLRFWRETSYRKSETSIGSADDLPHVLHRAASSCSASQLPPFVVTTHNVGVT